MSAVAALLDLFPNKSDLARDIGLKSPTHIGTMKVRMQINPFLWPAVVESARKRKVRGISIRSLHAAHQADAPLRETLKSQPRGAVSTAEPARASA
ncbi:hypothetical protein [Methylorubrum suomiense]|uniref:Uncharacterized protein n=1 Tax=Methylorubrum suomiense TaxID=144191 RepID=A0ABQ4UYC2_9HYPH|nr:hypothetical protein [Methylorubrum suomiense]GJE77217.1 hypothetical protein BGCPKDLD_3820 [Methylorubrum suomiense]